MPQASRARRPQEYEPKFPSLAPGMLAYVRYGGIYETERSAMYRDYPSYRDHLSMSGLWDSISGWISKDEIVVVLEAMPKWVHVMRSSGETGWVNRELIVCHDVIAP